MQSPSMCTPNTSAWNMTRTPVSARNASAASRQIRGSCTRVQVLPYTTGSVSPPMSASRRQNSSAKPNTTWVEPLLRRSVAS